MYMDCVATLCTSYIVWYVSFGIKSETDLFNILSNAAISIDCDVEPKNNDGRLKKNLLCKYDKSVHPSLTNDPITITLKMILKGFTFVSFVKVKRTDRFKRSKRLDFWTLILIEKSVKLFKSHTFNGFRISFAWISTSNQFLAIFHRFMQLLL